MRRNLRICTFVGCTQTAFVDHKEAQIHQKFLRGAAKGDLLFSVAVINQVLSHRDRGHITSVLLTSLSEDLLRILYEIAKAFLLITQLRKLN